jgi:hypothetical protein
MVTVAIATVAVVVAVVAFEEGLRAALVSFLLAVRRLLTNRLDVGVSVSCGGRYLGSIQVDLKHILLEAVVF